MAQRKRWVYDPHGGGTKISDSVKLRTEARIQKYAEENFAGKYTRIEVRFRSHFCYIDAYTEPVLAPGWPPADWPETREEFIERMRNMPTHLCRLRYFGDEESWGFAFFAYSSEKYELSVFPNGEFRGTPEDAFQASGMYLQ